MASPGDQSFSAGSVSLSIRPDLRKFPSELRTELAKQKTPTVPVDLFPQFGKFKTDLRAGIKGLKTPTVAIDVKPNTKSFGRNLRTEINAMPRQQVLVDVMPNMTGFRGRLGAEVRGVNTPTVRVGVDLDFGVARAQMAAFRATHHTLHMNVDIDITGALARIAALQAASAGLNVTANAVGSIGASAAGMASPVGIATAALAGLAAVTLIPLAASASQALGVLALLPAAGAAATAGLGALIVGGSGVAGAFSAMGDASSSAGESVEDSARRQQDALDSVADAQQRVTDSQRDATLAVQRASDAQQDLNDARKDAKNAIDDMNLSLKQGQLSEEAAVLSVFRARQRLAEAQADPKSSQLDIAEASLGVRQAEQSVTEVRVRNSQKRDEARGVNAKGVEGSDQVVSATRNLAEAQFGVISAQRDTATATRDLAKAQQDAARSLTDAAGGADKLAEALAKLSPNARDFVLKMQALGPEWSELRRAVQDNLFAGLGDSITTLANAQLPTLQTGLSGIADVINKNLRGALEGLSTESAKSDFALIFENSRIAIDNLLGGLRNLGGAFLDITAVGSEFLPELTGEDGFLGWTERFANKIKEMRESGDLKDFIQGAIDKFGELWDIGGQIVELIGNIFNPSKETGDGMLTSISDTLKKWNEILGSPEGQKEMKDFFQKVKDTWSEIAAIVSGIASVISTVTSIGKSLGLGGNGDADRPENVSTDGQGLDHKNGFFPGVKDGSFGDKLLDGDWLGSIGQVPKVGAQMAEPLGMLVAPGLTNRIKGDLGIVSDAFTNMKDIAGDAFASFPEKFSSFRDGVTGIASDALDFITNGAGFSWQGLGNTVGNVIDSLTGGAFTRFKDGATGVASHIQSLSAPIANVWYGILDTIKAVIGAIGRQFQKIPSIDLPFGISTKGIKELGDSLVAFSSSSSNVGMTGGTQIGKSGPVSTRAAGGPIVGAGTATSDSIPALLSNGEHVLTADEVQAAGGQGAVYRLREAIRNGTVGRFASGGAAVSNARSYIDSVVGTPYQLGGLDCSMFASGVYQALTGGNTGQRAFDTTKFATAASAAAMGFQPGLFGSFQVGVNPLPGASGHMAFSLDGVPGESGGSHGDVAFGSGSGAIGADDSSFPLQYSLPGALFAPPQSDADSATPAVDYNYGVTPLEGGNYSPTGTYVGPATGLGGTSAADAPSVPTLSEIGGKIGTAIGAGLPQLLGLEGTFFDDPANSTVGRAYSIFSAPRVAPGDPFAQRPTGDAGAGSQLSTPGGNPNPTPPTDVTNPDPAGVGRGADAYDPSQGAVQWQPEVLLGLNRTGQSVGALAATLQQISYESGGNPTITQGVKDVNSGGNEAVGLLQVIPNTFAAMRDPALPNDRTNPLANIVAGINWVVSRWGGIEERWPTRGGYALGGPVVGPGTGTSDSIPTRLSNGEFVMRANAVTPETLPILQAMNSGQSWAAAAAANAQQFRRQPAMAGASSSQRSEDWSINMGDVYTRDESELENRIDRMQHRRFRSYTGGLR
ncbi:hypothetical protein CH260_12700 [Rhodococcus sp. 05-2256-B2]|uniref:transglycosylase SLT domain-containing protein n=1 Tax=unclassified Rhodococcus (in: high G+C Gram-positive bacteria) TaxID=192944 RepID=UPI000B9C4CFD|nr:MULTISPECIES: transglycosylase SLT domain-containing protein [unclassified Rhodococcus (in: high G+C Gram-positive bacteria)]OZD82911.1 hypothetical protein CH258_18205 [Rhodococcus sp. 05-2256-B4]OZD96170.1 hypothetical protein CH260_12700 [Rhodococcus sp. 05-2256-B2]OZD96592.1 hypothetical protein CH257_04860 [Rhodococcus sp. 05-2256-B3]OZD99568.1 hypothetical protein CH285_20810 [Rhodococcus sp. 05-2256-B1]